MTEDDLKSTLFKLNLSKETFIKFNIQAKVYAR